MVGLADGVGWQSGSRAYLAFLLGQLWKSSQTWHERMGHTHTHTNRPAAVVLMPLPTTTTTPTPTSIMTATTTSGITKTQQPASLAGSLGLAVTAAHVYAY